MATWLTETGELNFLMSEDGIGLDILPTSSFGTKNGALFLKALALGYALGAAVYHCKALALAYNSIALNFQRSHGIVSHEQFDLCVFSGQLEPYFEFDALLSASRRAYDKIGHCVWDGFEGGGSGMPDNMEMLLRRLKKCPVPLKERLNESWSSTGSKLKDYRDCTQHFASTDLGAGTGGVFMQKLDLDVFKVWARIPDNPEVKSPKKFTYRGNYDALKYGWHVVSELNSLAREALDSISE